MEVKSAVLIMQFIQLTSSLVMTYFAFLFTYIDVNHININTYVGITIIIYYIVQIIITIVNYRKKK